MRQKRYRITCVTPSRMTPQFCYGISILNGYRHKVHKNLQCLSPRRNWDPPPSLPPASVYTPPPSPEPKEGGGTLACGRGGGGAPIRTTGEKAWHSVYSADTAFELQAFPCKQNLNSICINIIEHIHNRITKS